MVYKCCVPKCRGNYGKETKACVFQFPKDEAMRRKWINTIPRKDFQPTTHSRVCELHFSAEDILWETTYVDDRSGRMFTAPLQKPRLKVSAVPSIFPGCLSYFTASTSTRDSPRKKRQRLESDAVEAALSESLKTQQSYEEEHKLSSFDKFLCLVKEDKHSSFWEVVIRSEKVIYICISSGDPPVLLHSVVVDSNFNVRVFNKEIELTRLADFHLPLQASKMYKVYSMLDAVVSCNTIQYLLGCSISDVIKGKAMCKSVHH